MSLPFVVTAVAAVVVLTLGAIWVSEDAVQAYFFGPLERGRALGAVLIGGLIVLTWLRSGVGWKIVAAMVIVAFGVAFVYFEEPHRDVR